MIFAALPPRRIAGIHVDSGVGARVPRAAVRPAALPTDAADLAWDARSLRDLTDQLAARHPDSSRAAIEGAARKSLHPDHAEIEIARLESALRAADARIRQLATDLAAVRGAALDAWLGREDSREAAR